MEKTSNINKNSHSAAKEKLEKKRNPESIIKFPPKE